MTFLVLNVYKSMFLPVMILFISYVAYKAISRFPKAIKPFSSTILLITFIGTNVSFVSTNPVPNSDVFTPQMLPSFSINHDLPKSPPNRILTVDAEGGGNYTSLAEALENVFDPSESNRWKIIIRPSDVPYIEDWSRLYDASKPFVEIVGEDREAVVIRHSGSTDGYDREGLRLLPGMVVSNLTIDCSFVRDSAALIMGRWNSDPVDWPINGNYNVSKVNMYNCPYGGSTVVTYRSRNQNYLAPGEHHFYVEDVHYNYNETPLTYQEQYEKEMYKAWGHSWKVQPDPDYTPSIFLHYKNIKNDIVELRHEWGTHWEQTCLALIVHCSECSYEEADNYMKVNQFIFLDNFNCSYYAPDYQHYIFNPWEVRNDFGNFDPPLAYDTVYLVNSFWEIVINVDFNIYPGTVTVEDSSQYVHADGDLNFVDEGIQRSNRFIIEGGSGYHRCEYIITDVSETTLTLDKPFGDGYWCQDDLGTGTNASYRIGKSHSTNMGMTPSADPSRPEIPACYIRNFQFLVYDPDEGLNPIPERRDGLGGYPRGLTPNWIPPKCDSENVYSNIWSFGNPPSTLPGPEISLASPENKTYTTDSIDLTFNVDEPVYWKGYILDNDPVKTIEGNTTLTNLSTGSHCLTVFARNHSTSMGNSSICFSVTSPPPWETAFIEPRGYPIVDFAVYHEKLYAAADSSLYTYNGSSWSIIPAPTYIISLEPYENELIVGGQGGLYFFDGTTFNLIFSVSTYIKVLGVYNDTLYAGTILAKPPILYYCNGPAENPSNWHADTDFSAILNFCGPFGSIDSFAVYNNVMYVTSGSTVYSFNGTSWGIMKAFDGVYAFLDMKIHNEKLYLATRDVSTRCPLYRDGSGFCGRIIEFEGGNWITVFNHTYWIFALETYDGKLFAGTANKIYTYNGIDWNVSFNTTEGAYYAISLITYDGKIYAGMGNGYIFADTSPGANSETVAIPEFPSFIFLPLFMLTMLVAVLIKRRKRVP